MGAILAQVAPYRTTPWRRNVGAAVARTKPVGASIVHGVAPETRVRRADGGQ
ncbi:hypothetical protein Q5762_18995 [Streptomyces sp. P9(2023)]|uniref:hypothetical protein n=1 Tax=Streptomyces sp. P9(2023) TaxID=3064394 RepID=UPI0028F43BAF|nr:hypothetical protein [Streptomyces sp. P9(2023)]MDT9690389.1 hypothetical protein [Streptomyces sp. P9(2023)]